MAGHRRKILITGATGFSGVHACDYAIQSGYELITIGRSERGFGESTHCQCDITDFDQVSHCIETSKPDYILHLAGWNDARSSWDHPLECLRANVLGTANLLESIRTHSPYSKVVIIGSALEYSPTNNEQPPHPYSLSKTMQILFTEGWKQLFPLHVSIVKPTNLIGPGYSNGICSIIAAEIARAERDKSSVNLQIQNMKAKCDFLDVRDAVKAYFHVIESSTDHTIFEIGSGRSRELHQVITAYETLSSRPFHIEVGKSMETNDVKINQNPIRMLGWKPHYTFQQSLEDILQFQRSILIDEDL